MVLDEAGKVTESYAVRHPLRGWYSSYGEVVDATITGQSPAELKFTGHVEENEGLPGFYYAGARYFNSAMGIWYSGDPAGQGFSPYTYCGNSPLMYVDEDGEFFVGALLLGYALYGAYQGYKQSGGDWMYAIPGAIQGGMQGVVAAASFKMGGMVFKKTGSLLLSHLTTSSASSVGNYALSGGRSDFSVSAGPFSYNFTKKDFNIANPFDDKWTTWRGLKQGMLDWMSWGPFLHDTRNVPGMKYVRFANGALNTAIGIIYANFHGDKFSHFDWDDLVFYYNTKGDRGSAAPGHTISTGSGILESMSQGGELPKSILRTLAHERMHVLQSGSFGLPYLLSYYINEGASYLFHFMNHGNFTRTFGSPEDNLFEIWAMRHAERVSGIPY